MLSAEALWPTSEGLSPSSELPDKFLDTGHTLKGSRRCLTKGNTDPCSQLNDFGHPLKDSPHPLSCLTSAWTPGTLSKRARRRCVLRHLREHWRALSFNSSHKGNPCSQLNDFGHPLKDSPHPLSCLTSFWTPGTLSKGAGAAASLTKGNTDPPSLSIVLTKGPRALRSMTM